MDPFSTTIDMAGIPTAHEDALSDAGSTSSKSSVHSSAPRKLKIKTKKASSNSDNDSVTSSTDVKKTRKKRTTKPNELEKYGFNPEMTWTFPRFKKYMEDVDRNLQTYNTVQIVSDSVQNAGYILTFQKGVKEETILVLTSFEPTMMKSPTFMAFINEFTNNTPKSSRLVILHTSAKAWGDKKVTQALEIVKGIVGAPATQGTESRKIHLNDGSAKEAMAVEVMSSFKEATIVPVKAAPVPNTKTGPIDLHAEIAKVFEEYQSQREALDAQMKLRMQGLMVGFAQSLV